MPIEPVPDILSPQLADGVRVISREPFRAITATDQAGHIRRHPPVRIVQPLGECLDVPAFLAADLYEPISIFAYVAGEATLVGERAVVTKGGKHLITDTDHQRHTANIFHEPERRRFEFTKLEGVPGGFEARSGVPVQRVTGPLVTLTSMEQANFGAFLLRSLPKLILVKQLGLLGHPMLCGTQPWQREMLTLAGVDVSNTISYDPVVSYSVEELIVPSMRTSEFFLDDGARNFFFDLAERAKAQVNRHPRSERLYVSRLSRGRTDPNYRHFLNEQELIDVLEPLGFHIFEPEAHSIAEQIAAFAHARFVVGPGGAGMFNTVFCRPGTTVISLEPMLNWLGLHANIFASMGHKVALVLGGADEADLTIQKRWRTDIRVVTKLVHDLAP